MDVDGAKKKPKSKGGSTPASSKKRRKATEHGSLMLKPKGEANHASLAFLKCCFEQQVCSMTSPFA